MILDSKFEARLMDWYLSPAKMVRELFDEKPNAWQEKVLDEYGKTKRVALILPRGGGASTALAWMAWNFLLTRPHSRIFATSAFADNSPLGLLFEMAKWRRKSELLNCLFDMTTTRVYNRECPMTWWMLARNWPKNGQVHEQANAMAGLMGDHTMCLIDRAANVPVIVLLSALASVHGDGDNHVVVAGTDAPVKENSVLGYVRNNETEWKIIGAVADHG